MPHRQALRRACTISLVAFLAVLGCKKNVKKDGGDSIPPPVDKSGSGSSGGDPRSKGQAGGNDAPPGWCEARDAAGGYRVFMPGDKAVTPDFSKAGGQENRPTGCYAAIRNPNINAEVHTFSLLPSGAVKLGTAPDELFAGLKSFNQAIDSHHDVLEKTPTTLDGKSALKVVLKKKPSSRPKSDFGNDPFLAKIEVEQAAREKQEQAKRQVFYITNTRSRIIIIQVDTPGEPEPAVLKTITDSFAFL